MLDDTPAAEGQSAMAALGDVAGATATGATIGSVIPGIGTAVGAVIGALISIGDDIADAIEGPPDPSQNEYRYRSDRACFQAAAAGYPYGVIPGFMRWNPRGGAGAWFYQSTQGPYTAASRAFTFSVTWIALPGSTDTTKGQAWLLCQIFMASDSVTRGNYQPNTTAWGTATAALQAQVGAAKLGRWLALVARWYGAPSSFSPVRPYESTGEPAGHREHGRERRGDDRRVPGSPATTGPTTRSHPSTTRPRRNSNPRTPRTRRM